MDVLAEVLQPGRADCRQVYDKAQPGYRGRCTAPLLIDKKTKRIISNESPEILAALYKMQLPGSTDINLVPEELSQAAAELKSLIYNQVHHGCLSTHCRETRTIRY